MLLSARQLTQVTARQRKQRRRARGRLLPRMREASDLAYRSDLLDVAATAQRIVEDELRRFFSARRDSVRTDSLPDEFRRLWNRVRIRTSQAVAKIAPALAARMVRDVELDNRRNMNAQLRAVVPIDVLKSNRDAAHTMRARVQENVRLITSIPAQHVERVIAIVEPAAAAGVRVEEISKRVNREFAVTKRRAKLIARDQVGKFNAQLAQTRQRALGITAYVWSTSRDERVRIDHQKLEGSVQSYDAPPPIVDIRTGRRAHPGEDYQCRCQALPRVESLLDVLGIPDVNVIDG